MEETKSLRETAERCFRLARTIDAQDVIEKLLELGRQYETQAQSIEAASTARAKMDEISN
jgi:hypothetical protein